MPSTDMNWPWKWNLFSFLFITSLVFISCAARNRQLTPKNILSVQPGMSVEEVKSYLGQPLVESIRISNEHCSCNPERICNDVKTHTFEYTKRKTEYPYAMLWVHFDDQHKVKELYIKKFTGLSKWPIYMVKRELCDTIDEYLPRIEEDRIDSLHQFFH